MELHPKGWDLSLERIRRLLAKLGDPQDRLPPVVHVAGTNGKGSTIAFLRAMLASAGLSVHVHTSPHLVRWHERYVVSGREVDDDTLADAIGRVAHVNAGEPITVFELLTAVAFILFSEHPAHVTLMEVGLGGRCDSTNVMAKKALTVITPIGLDHQAHLGETRDLIAREKAGILREGVPLVLAPQVEEARDAIDTIARPLGIDPFAQGQDYSAHDEHGRLVYQDFLDGGVLLDLPLPSLPGPHQIENAATAIAAMRVLARRGVVSLDDDALQAAVEMGLTRATWPGRLQHIADGPLLEGAPPSTEIWLDGGHNPHAAEAVAQHLAMLGERRDRPLFLVVGMLDNKDSLGFLRTFEGLVRHVFTVPLASTDAFVPPERLAEIAREAGLSAEPVDSVAEALAVLYRDWEYEPHGSGGGGEGSRETRAPRVLVTGSLYLVGDVLALSGSAGG